MNQINFHLFLFSILILAGCAHQEKAQRNVAAESCMNKIKPEYHSYFESVEKCLESSSQQ